MPLSTLLQSETSVQYRQPDFSIGFGAGTGLSAGVSGLGLGGEDPWKAHTVAIRSETVAAPGVSNTVVVIASGDQAPDVALEDEGEIQLGYTDGEMQVVMSAMVNRITPTVHGITRIEARDGSGVLARQRINQSYEQQTAGDIVSDLAAQAGMDTDTVESGPDLPFYVIDDRCSAWDHIAVLARKSGYCAYFTVENALYFGPLTAGQPARTLKYGQDILGFQGIETAPVSGGMTIIGGGAAGSQGDDAWSWLVKDPGAVTAEAGGGGRIKTIPGLRSADAVQTAAQGILAETQRRAAGGRILVPGAPDVVVGSTIELSDLPEDRLNGDCLVTRVVHDFSKRDGFTSRIYFCRPEDAGAGGLI